MSSGTVKCWGRDDDGRVGDVGSLATVTAIAAGGAHTCALLASREVQCWGNNTDGRLGDGTVTSRADPAPVSALTNVEAIAAGGAHTCALMSSGGVYCWGLNDHGQVGDGADAGHRSQPSLISGLSASKVSAGGGHTCAVLSTGGAKCWGWNAHGQLGDGSDLDRSVPTQVTGLTSGVDAISAGDGHTCALLSDGGAKCWGLASSGQLGSDAGVASLFPLNVTGLPDSIRAISTGGTHTCALLLSGELRCFGANQAGQLGDGNNDSRAAPEPVTGLRDVTGVATGLSHTCALGNQGVHCWGDNTYGQLGATDGGSNVPVRVDL